MNLLWEIEDDRFKDQHGTRWTNDSERLPREQMPRDTADQTRDQRLHSSLQKQTRVWCYKMAKIILWYFQENKHGWALTFPVDVCIFLNTIDCSFYFMLSQNNVCIDHTFKIRHMLLCVMFVVVHVWRNGYISASPIRKFIVLLVPQPLFFFAKASTFYNTHDVVFGSRAEQTAKSDDWSETSEVDEEEGSEALDVNGVLEVWGEPGHFALDVRKQTAKQPVGGIRKDKRT